MRVKVRFTRRYGHSEIRHRCQARTVRIWCRNGNCWAQVCRHGYLTAGLYLFGCRCGQFRKTVNTDRMYTFPDMAYKNNFPLKRGHMRKRSRYRK